MVGRAEGHIDADEQDLIGNRVEISTELRVPAKALGKIAVGRMERPASRNSTKAAAIS